MADFMQIRPSIVINIDKILFISEEEFSADPNQRDYRIAFGSHGTRDLLLSREEYKKLLEHLNVTQS